MADIPAHFAAAPFCNKLPVRICLPAGYGVWQADLADNECQKYRQRKKQRHFWR